MADPVKVKVPFALNPWLSGAIVGLAICGVVYFVGNKIVKGQVAQLKAELVSVKAESKQKLDAIDGKVTVLMGQVSAKDKQIADLTSDKIKLEKKDADDVAALAAAKAKLKDAPPETLVAEGRRIIQTKEINYIKPTNIVEFSLDAYRNNVFKLVEWEAFTLKIIPDKDAMIKNLGDANKVMASENKDLKDIHALDNQWKGVANDTMTHYYNLAMQSLAPGFWKQFLSQAKTAVPSFALGIITGMLVKK